MQPHYRFAGFMGKRVHLGVSGSIAAYKALDLLRSLQEADCRVSATVTDGAAKFVAPLSFEALGASPVYTTMFDGTGQGDTAFGHLEPGQDADVLLIAPASASTMARLACGLADDMLSCQALAFPGPKLVAPAMNPRMWAAPATRRNWETLGELGYVRIEPDSGHVACGDTGAGRLAAPETILTATLKGAQPAGPGRAQGPGHPGAHPRTVGRGPVLVQSLQRHHGRVHGHGRPSSRGRGHGDRRTRGARFSRGRQRGPGADRP